MSDALDSPDFDLDEDLFDFAKVVSDSDELEGSEEDLADVLASFRDAAAAETGSEPAPEDVADLVAEALEPRVARANDALEAQKSVAQPASRKAAAPAGVTPKAEPTVSMLPAARPARVSRGLVAIALSVTLLNSALAVVFLRRSPSHGEEVRAVDSSTAAHEAPAPASTVPAASAPSAGRALPDPDLATRIHGHPALDSAREELARGDYAACRQRVYSLLSVIDRFEDPRRDEVEAECQFLIAQALHLEALARLGRSE